jgi:transcriptional regulator with GAF, ATPase, and Fis domain
MWGSAYAEISLPHPPAGGIEGGMEAAATAQRHAEIISHSLAAPDQPAATFAALADALQDLVGHKVFTVLRFDGSGLRSRRLFSTLRTYPPGAIKEHRRGAWHDAVIGRGEPFVAPTTTDIRAAFPDHAGIEAAGCGSIMALPVRWNGATLATVNVWHVSGHYDRAAAHGAWQLASLLVPASLGAAPP